MKILDYCGVFERPGGMGQWMEDEAAPPRWGYGPEFQLGIGANEEVGGSYYHSLGVENNCYPASHAYRPSQTNVHGYRTPTHGRLAIEYL